MTKTPAEIQHHDLVDMPYDKLRAEWIKTLNQLNGYRLRLGRKNPVYRRLRTRVDAAVKEIARREQ